MDETRLTTLLKIVASGDDGDSRIPTILNQQGDMTIDEYVHRLLEYGSFDDEMYFAITILLCIKNRFLVTKKTILRIFGALCFVAYVNDNCTERVQRQYDRILDLICLTPDELYSILSIDFDYRDNEIYNFSHLTQFQQTPYNTTKLIIETLSPLLMPLVTEMWITTEKSVLEAFHFKTVTNLNMPSKRLFMFDIAPKLFEDFGRVWFDFDSLVRFESGPILNAYLEKSRTCYTVAEECLSMIPIVSSDSIETCRSMYKCLIDANKFKNYLLQQITKSSYRSHIKGVRSDHSAVYHIMKSSFENYGMKFPNQLPLSLLYSRKKIPVLIFLWNGSLTDPSEFDAIPLYIVELHRFNPGYNTYTLKPEQYHRMLLTRVPKIRDIVPSIDNIVKFNLDAIKTIYTIYLTNYHKDDVTLGTLFQHKELEYYKDIADKIGLELDHLVQGYDYGIIELRYYFLNIINFAYRYVDLESKTPHAVMDYFNLYDIVDYIESHSMVRDIYERADLPPRTAKYAILHNESLTKVETPGTEIRIHGVKTQYTRYVYNCHGIIHDLMITRSVFSRTYVYRCSELDPFYFVRVFGLISYESEPPYKYRLVLRHGVPFNESTYTITRKNMYEFLGVLEYLKYKKLSIHPAYLKFDNVLVYPSGQLVFGLVRMEETTDMEPLFDFLLELETRWFCNR